MNAFERAEARAVIEYFTNAEDGEAVMDGGGVIWQRSGDAWYSKRGSLIRRATPTVLARALCPDLAEHFEAVEA